LTTVEIERSKRKHADLSGAPLQSHRKLPAYLCHGDERRNGLHCISEQLLISTDSELFMIDPLRDRFKVVLSRSHIHHLETTSFDSCHLKRLITPPPTSSGSFASTTTWVEVMQKHWWGSGGGDDGSEMHHHDVTYMRDVETSNVLWQHHGPHYTTSVAFTRDPFCTLTTLDHDDVSAVSHNGHILAENQTLLFSEHIALGDVELPEGANSDVWSRLFLYDLRMGSGTTGTTWQLPQFYGPDDGQQIAGYQSCQIDSFRTLWYNPMTYQDFTLLDIRKNHVLQEIAHPFLHSRCQQGVSAFTHLRYHNPWLSTYISEKASDIWATPFDFGTLTKKRSPTSRAPAPCRAKGALDGRSVPIFSTFYKNRCGNVPYHKIGTELYGETTIYDNSVCAILPEFQNQSLLLYGVLQP
jgi:hypothetical protein